jgi:hypothetical protein
MAKKKPIKPVENAKRAKLLAGHAVGMAGYAAKAYIAAAERGIKTKPIQEFPLDENDRATVAEIPTLPANLKKKLEKKDAAFTVVDVVSMLMAISESVVGAEWRAMLLVAMKLKDCLEANLLLPAEPMKTKKPKPTDTVYQLKITLKESQPPIWRRIQVKDCTLDKMHEHIQTVMGWTNSHLHHFKIGEQFYGDPMLIGDNFEEFEYEDSTTTTLSDIIPENRRKFRFEYEYDFGDSWYHEILFEGHAKEEPGKKYPLCLDGERACPPEDCGGIWGYPDFIQAIENQDHERHEELLEWIGGSFDPEVFDPAAATKEMKKGLGNWRKEAW